MKTLISFRKTQKLAFAAILCFMLPVFLTAQTPDEKESLTSGSEQQPLQLKDSTVTVSNFDPVVSDLESGNSTESEKKDTSMNEKKESFTPSQDEWLKNAGYFKTNKGSATKKSKRKSIEQHL